MNPFLSEYDTPFSVPPFDLIESEHFLPAFREGIRKQEAEIESIVSNADIPTFDNTIAAFDLSGKVLRKVEGVFYRLQDAETSDEIDSIAKILVPITSEHKSNMVLNEALFDRVKTVYNSRESSDLSREQSRVLEKIYQRFVKGGASLDAGRKIRIREIDAKLSMLTLQFGNNVLAETNNYKLFLEDEKDLSGLTESVRSAASEAAAHAGQEGKWLITLHKPSWMPFLQYAKNRQLREEVYRVMFMRGDNGNEYDNKEIIKEILALRLERSNMLGYETYADYAFTDRMAKEPENVYDLLMKIWEPALEKAGEEAAMMQELIDNDQLRIEYDK